MFYLSSKTVFLLFRATFLTGVSAGYCNWGPLGTAASSTCNLEVQGGSWCNVDQNNCADCGGKWCTNDGYCNWGPLGTAASSTCDLEVEGGDWCNINKNNCETGCQGKWCTNNRPTIPTPPMSTPPTTKSPKTNPPTTNSPKTSPPTTNSPKTNPPTNASTKTTPPTPPSPTPGTLKATTTRYWDCSGGACACSYVPTGMSEPSHCYSNAMFAAPTNNPYGAKFYGAAAISASLGGGNWMAQGCGKCFKVTGISNAPGFAGVTTTLVLKGTNFCPDENPLCKAGPHFDIAAPGFDVLEFSFSHVCPQMEPKEATGFASCSKWLINDSNPNINCNCSLFKNPVLRSGCENFFSLKWDNPTVDYQVVTCPQELASLHCSFPYALEATMPATCARNDFSAPSTKNPTSKPTFKPTSKPTFKPTSKKPTFKPTSKPTSK